MLSGGSWAWGQKVVAYQEKNIHQSALGFDAPEVEAGAEVEAEADDEAAAEDPSALRFAPLVDGLGSEKAWKWKQYWS